MSEKKEARTSSSDSDNFIPGLVIGALLTAFANVAFQAQFIDDTMNWLQSEFSDNKTLKVVMPAEEYDAVRSGGEISSIYKHVDGAIQVLREYDAPDPQ